MGIVRLNKLRIDNKTGIPGIHKFDYGERKPLVRKLKKRKKLQDKWVVQIKARYRCICHSFDEAVYERWLAEKNEGMINDDPMESLAYQYLLKHKLLKGDLK